MKSIQEQLVCLETLIGQIEEGEERFIIEWLKNATESTARAKSLYISLVAELSERLKSTEETIVILKWAIINTPNGVSILKPKLFELKPFAREKSSEELKKRNYGTWSNTLVLWRSRVVEQADLTVMYLTRDAKLWLRIRTKEDLNVGHTTFETWDRLKQELKDQFLSNNTLWIAGELEKAQTW